MIRRGPPAHSGAPPTAVLQWSLSHFIHTTPLFHPQHEVSDSRRDSHSTESPLGFNCLLVWVCAGCFFLLYCIVVIRRVRVHQSRSVAVVHLMLRRRALRFAALGLSRALFAGFLIGPVAHGTCTAPTTRGSMALNVTSVSPLWCCSFRCLSSISSVGSGSEFGATCLR